MCHSGCLLFSRAEGLLARHTSGSWKQTAHNVTFSVEVETPHMSIHVRMNSPHCFLTMLFILRVDTELWGRARHKLLLGNRREGIWSTARLQLLPHELYGLMTDNVFFWGVGIKWVTFKSLPSRHSRSLIYRREQSRMNATCEAKLHELSSQAEK